MSYITPARRMSRLPAQLFARLMMTTQALTRAGNDVINLGQGNPDLPTPAHVVEAARRAAMDPATHKYSAFSGLTTLKDAAARWYARQYEVALDAETEICILIGSKLGLQEISLCLLNEGDFCLMPDPGYPDYWSGVALAGARSYSMPLTAENRFLPDLNAIPKEVASAAKLMFLNYPTNPTGAVAGPEFFADVVGFARQNEIVVAHDLAYGDMFYDGRRPISFLQIPGAKEVGVEFCTLSKSYNMAGWRIGFVAGNNEIIAAMNLLQDHLNCSQWAAIQLAAAAALDGPQDCVHSLRDVYQHRRDTWVESARAIGWQVEPSAGSVFVWCPVPDPFTSESFTDLLLRECHVVVAPGVGFGPAGEGYVRVSLTSPAERLAEAARRVGRLGVF
ncbi:MAG TPA: aminotransferase class I/II-fold pyridoxal phosphate-dependent enzyme [Symbiobacteriaceae bacterium]|nr:aminotransferase class I/II-fold pyridoxal phosphate-dependent enzyme [Symbiobacteriaceae bacterium]